MSSFLKKVINPRTGKKQVALYQDNYYGNHIYGIGFRKDGKDYKFSDVIDYVGDLEFFREEEVNL